MKRVFFAGTPLAGRWTTMNAIGRVVDPTFDPSTRPFDDGGWLVRVPRSNSSLLLRAATRTSAAYDMLDDKGYEQEADFVRAADVICYVIDSQRARADANVFGIGALLDLFARMGREPSSVPVVFQLNKRDLADVTSVEDCEHLFLWSRREFVPTVATRGEGIERLLRAIANIA